MSCTIWATWVAGYSSLMLIPYPMKREYDQRPEHLFEKFKHEWFNLSYTGREHNLQPGEYVIIQESVESVLQKEREAELEFKKQRLKSLSKDCNTAVSYFLKMEKEI